MELKPGYRLSEVGVIPEDWEVEPLFGLVADGPRNGYSGRSAKDARGTLTLSLSATTSGRLVLSDETVKRLHETIAPTQGLYLQPGDVLVQRSNTLELVGTTAVFDGPADTYVYPDLMMRLRFRNAATAHWFWRYANSANGRRFFVSAAAGSTGSMPKISGETLRKLLLPLPSLPEQRAIADILSDTDALLAGLDRLIVKKRNLKRAAMQQLLTGRTRLPGFDGEWATTQLGKVVDIDPESLRSDIPSDFTFNYIALEDVDRGLLRSHSEQVFAIAPSRARRKLRNGDVLVSTVRPNLQSHLLFGSKVGEWVCSTGFSVLRCREGISHPAYVFYYLFTSSIVRQIDALLTGSNYPAINSNDVRALYVLMPTYREQVAIAAVLSDMEAELSALEARRAKTHALKQAMIQELLTGRTRLL
jgi:type I restriction enzyme S subunit